MKTEPAEVKSEEESRRRQLANRASRIRYKDIMPKFPKQYGGIGMIGYAKRMANWSNILKHRERAYNEDHGIFVPKPEKVQVDSPNAIGNKIDGVGELDKEETHQI